VVFRVQGLEFRVYGAACGPPFRRQGQGFWARADANEKEARRFRVKRERPERFHGVINKRQGHDLALTVLYVPCSFANLALAILYVPCSLDSGQGLCVFSVEGGGLRVYGAGCRV